MENICGKAMEKTNISEFILNIWNLPYRTTDAKAFECYKQEFPVM